MKKEVKVTKFFRVENVSISKKLEESVWGEEGYDEAVVGKRGYIERADFDNLWVTKGDSQFQPTVSASTVQHFIDAGFAISKMKESDTGVKGPIRLVFYDGKYYVHDGHHRLAAAIIRREEKLKVHIWRLKL